MKYPALLLFAIVLTFCGCSASAQTGGAPAGTEADDGGLHGFRRPTPKPQTAPTGPKKPLEASLSRDDKGRQTTSAFTTADPKVYLQWKDPSGSKGDKVTLAVVAVETGGVFPKNKKVTESAQTVAGPGAFGTLFINAPAAGLPPGKYRADVYDGTKLAKSLPFTVAKK